MAPQTTTLPLSKDLRARATGHHRHRQVARNLFSSSSSRFNIFILCAMIGITSVAIITFALLRPPRVVTIIRCGRSEDTLQTFLSTSHDGSEKVELMERPKILGFVGIQTGFDSVERRRALRSSWFPADPDALVRLENATGLAFRFVIGMTKDARKMAGLEMEEELYHDFMFIDHEEEYLRLSYKTLAFFKAAYNLFEASFYVKMDDDVYLRPDRLAILLSKDRKDPLTYIGCMKNGSVVKDPTMKWYESEGYLVGDWYFLHGYGTIYALSLEVVSALATTRTESLRMFTNEDVAIGAWMLAMNVTHEQSNDLCDYECSPTSIAVWDIPVCGGLCDPINKLNELHNDPKCSKSPTIPLNEI